MFNVRYVSCKNVAILYFTIFGTPNDITLVLAMKLLLPRVIQSAIQKNTARLDSTLDNGKKFSRKVRIKLLE
jgi:hypothetical protein